MLDFLTLNTALTLAGVCLFVQLSNRINQVVVQNMPTSTEDYLFKIARITGTSEYHVFIKAAEAWPVSQSMIEHDFREYLLKQTVPHYVNDFVRKNKQQIDDIQLNQF